MGKLDYCYLCCANQLEMWLMKNEDGKNNKSTNGFNIQVGLVWHTKNGWVYRYTAVYRQYGSQWNDVYAVSCSVFGA